MAKTAIWRIAAGLVAGLVLSSIAWPAKKTTRQFLNPGGKKPGYTQVVKSPPRGNDGNARSVKGHSFGLRLSSNEKGAPIAFLRKL